MQKLYYNQKLISFQSVPKNANNKFGIYNKDALFAAANTLSKNAFKLYLYLGSFQEIKEDFYLSRQDVLSKMHMSKNAYFSATKELKQRGYLIQDTQPDAWIFVERPTL